MDNNFLRVSSVLCELQEPASTEKAIATLTALNEMISSSQREVEFLYEAGVFQLIINILKRDRKLATLCLKILANASKKNEKIRMNLLKNNIFHLLAVQLKKERDYSTGSLILYSALMVILVQENHEAQTQMRASGCLSSIAHILSRSLEDAERISLPWKNTELLIFAIIASIKNPQNSENQTEVGWITPKIVEYLARQKIFTDNQTKKCFWSFLKCLVDKNESNQKIFLKSSGMIVLFRSAQEILNEGKCKELDEILVKITGLLVKMKSQKEFLYQAATYCSIMILSNLLKSNNSLVIQHTVLFLESLTQEFPHSLSILGNKKMLKGVQRAAAVLSKSKLTATLCHEILNRMGIFSREDISSQTDILSQTENFNNIFSSDPGPDDAASEHGSLYNLQNHFCILHDTDLSDFQLCSTSLFDSSKGNLQVAENKIRNRNLGKIRLSPADVNFYRRELRKKEKKLRTTLRQSYLRSMEGSRRESRSRILGWIFQSFRYLWSFFFCTQTRDEWDTTFFDDLDDYNGI